MNQELKSIVFQSFDLHLDLHQDAMTLETYQRVSKKFARFKSHIDDESYESLSEIDEIISLIGEHISWLTYHHGFSGTNPTPPYQDLYQNLLKAEQLLKFIRSFDNSSQDTINKHLNYIEDAKKLNFPFDYRIWLRNRKYLDGQVVALGVSESMEIMFFNYGESYYEKDKPQKRKNIYVRIGQEKPETRLFEFEYLSGYPHGEITLYEHHSINREEVTNFKKGDFWVYTQNDNQQYFLVYINGDISLTIGNLNEEVGVYVQKGD